MSTAVANADVAGERVAVQAAVLATLRDVAAGTPVWPWSSMRDLALSGPDAIRAARALALELRLDLTAPDLTGDVTVQALVDRALERAATDERRAR